MRQNFLLRSVYHKNKVTALMRSANLTRLPRPSLRLEEKGDRICGGWGVIDDSQWHIKVKWKTNIIPSDRVTRNLTKIPPPKSPRHAHARPSPREAWGALRLVPLPLGQGRHTVCINAYPTMCWIWISIGRVRARLSPLKQCKFFGRSKPLPYNSRDFKISSL